LLPEYGVCKRALASELEQEKLNIHY